MTKLKEARVKAGLTQEELSYMTDISLRSLQEYEQGRKPLGKAAAYTVLKLAQTLLCSMEQLID